MPDQPEPQPLTFDVNGPTGLRLLAEWFDVTRPHESDEVQRDLRRWATDMEKVAVTITALTEQLAEAERERDEALAGQEELSEAVYEWHDAQMASGRGMPARRRRAQNRMLNLATQFATAVGALSDTREPEA